MKRQRTTRRVCERRVIVVEVSEPQQVFTSESVAPGITKTTLYQQTAEHYRLSPDALAKQRQIDGERERTSQFYD